ncbi:MAG: diaminopimelate decarboxylase [Candidatus Omnitrophota bacterium]|nr:diaminopimelate decarboxylase [Candidatus Omnitrophota bacterium]
MHEFKYIGNDLCCEDLKVADIVKEFSTPVYIYSHKTLLDHYVKLKNAFSEMEPLICFSMKANSNLALCRALTNEGAGLDIVSGGELFKALHIGADPKKIVYASIGKTPQEIEYAVSSSILLFNVESIPELEMLNSIASKLGKRIDISLRLNPNINLKTHSYISTARRIDKFGLDSATCREIFLQADKFSNLNLVGLHIHIGSQIVESGPFIKAINKAVSLIEELRRQDITIQWLNIGGGLGIVYHQEKPQTAQEFALRVLPLLKKLNLKIILEPGRFIAGNSGILATRIVYIKQSRYKSFIIVDAGMNDLMRPSLYEAYHEILPVVRTVMSDMRNTKYDIVGPICESGDFLAKDRPMPPVRAGQLLAVMGAGAYGFTMSSNYNSRPRPAEVLVMNGESYLVRERENYQYLIKGESIPKNLL